MRNQPFTGSISLLKFNSSGTKTFLFVFHHQESIEFSRRRRAIRLKADVSTRHSTLLWFLLTKKRNLTFHFVQCEQRLVNGKCRMSKNNEFETIGASIWQRNEVLYNKGFQFFMMCRAPRICWLQLNNQLFFGVELPRVLFPKTQIEVFAPAGVRKTSHSRTRFVRKRRQQTRSVSMSCQGKPQIGWWK